MNLSAADLAEATKKLHAMASTNADGTVPAQWRQVHHANGKEEDNVIVYRRKDAQIHRFRGDARLAHSAERVAALLWNPKGKALFDPLCKFSTQVAHVDVYTRVEHQQYQTQQCAGKIYRDVLILQHMVRTESGQYLLLAQSDGVDQAALELEIEPEEKSSRAYVHVSGWLVTPLDDSGDGGGDSSCCTVTFVTQVNLGGVPVSIQNMVGHQQPAVLRRLDEYLALPSAEYSAAPDSLPEELKMPCCSQCFATRLDSEVISLRCANCNTPFSGGK